MTADVAIVGGGVIGLAVADRLARDGARVVVLERGAAGREASWAGAGIVEPCSWHRTDDLARLHRDAVFGFADFAADIERRSGIDPEFARCGALRPLRDDNRMKMAINEVRVVGERRSPEGHPIVTTLSVEQAQAIEPHFMTPMLGAQHCRLSAQVRNPRLLQGLVGCCADSGVDLRINAPVVGLLKQGAAVAGVRTADDEFPAGTTVICAGAWSSQLDPALAEAMPVYPVRGQIVLLHMNDLPLRHLILDGGFYLVPRRDGHLLVGSTEEHDAGFNARTSVQGIAMLTHRALEAVPALAGATVVRSWAGLRPGTPDRRPYMGPVPALPGCLACSGHFRTGLTTAPAVAVALSELVRTGSCSYDLRRCAPGRQPAAAGQPVDD